MASILIVDDDAFNVHSMQMILSSLQLKYESCYNGKLAIDKVVKNQSISFIFMDCNMPIIDGWQDTTTLKEDAKE